SSDLEAYLLGANFQEADLRHTLFYKAQMGGANLQRANLYEANLEEADIEHAELQGAYLYGANLRNAKLDGAKFDVRTVLPDSGWDDNLSRPTSFWTPDTDMSRFTDTDHPNFWQPEWAKTRQEK